MKKLFVLLAVVVLAGCAVSTPIPTSTVDFAREARETFIKTLNEGYAKRSATKSTFKCNPASWIEDEFKVTCKWTGDYSRSVVLSMQYILITSYAEALAGTGSDILQPSPDMVVKVIFTTGRFDKQIMSITKYSTLEKIENSSITETVEWIQEAEIVEP